MSETNYTPEELTLKDSVKKVIKGHFPGGDSKKKPAPKTSLFAGRSRMDADIDAAEEGRGKDAGPLVKDLWDK
jgi:hypothetical protein